MTCEARVPGIVVGCAELVIVESWRADDAPTLSSTQKVGTSHLRRVRRISTNDCTRAESRCRNRSFIGSRTTQLVRTCLYSNNALQSTCNLQLLQRRIDLLVAMPWRTAYDKPAGWFRCCSPLAFLCTRATLAFFWLATLCDRSPAPALTRLTSRCVHMPRVARREANHGPILLSQRWHNICHPPPSASDPALPALHTPHLPPSALSRTLASTSRTGHSSWSSSTCGSPSVLDLHGHLATPR